MAKNSILNKIYNSGPLVLLYYLCISEVDTNLERTTIMKGSYLIKRISVHEFNAHIIHNSRSQFRASFVLPSKISGLKEQAKYLFLTIPYHLHV